MPFYAELDENNIVIRAVKFGEGDTPESMGFEGRWEVTSSEIRNIQASPGFSFIEEHPSFPLGAFIEIQPFPSWTLDETTLQWEPPVPPPFDADPTHFWNEETLSWDIRPEQDLDSPLPE